MAYPNIGGNITAGFQAGASVAMAKQKQQQEQIQAVRKSLMDASSQTIDVIGQLKQNVLTPEQEGPATEMATQISQKMLETLAIRTQQGMISEEEALAARNSIQAAMQAPFKFQIMQQEIANKAATQKAVGDVQTDQAVGQAERMTPVLVDRARQEKEAGKPSVQNFYNPATGEQQSVDMSAAGATGKVNALIGGGYLALSQPVVQTTTLNALKDLPKSSQGKALDSMNKAEDALIRLGDIRARFKPEFLELPTRLKAGLFDTIDRIAPENLKSWLSQNANLMTEEDRALVGEYKSFIQTAFVTINETIRDITGAQMSIPEADRIMKQLPNPDKDGPVAFLSKLQTSMELMERDLQLAQARFNYLTQRGEAPDFGNSEYEPPITLRGMDMMIKARAKELLAEVRARNPDLTNSAMKEMVRIRLQNEFGI